MNSFLPDMGYGKRASEARKLGIKLIFKSQKPLILKLDAGKYYSDITKSIYDSYSKYMKSKSKISTRYVKVSKFKKLKTGLNNDK
jgi:hypothetical protein